MTDPTPHLFWITSRAAGTTALLLASASVSFGLLMGAKFLKRLGPDRLAIHEILGLSTMVAIAVHGLSLIGDSYLRPTLLDVTVPFLSSYETVPTTIGILAGWGTIILGLSYYVRKHIGIKRWKIIHRFTLLTWALGLVHTFTEGTDAGQPWFIALVLAASLPPLVLLGMRIARRNPAARHRQLATGGAAA